MPVLSQRSNSSRESRGCRWQVSGIRQAFLLANSTSNSQRDQLIAQLEEVQAEIAILQQDIGMREEENEKLSRELQEMDERRVALNKQHTDAQQRRRKLKMELNNNIKTLK
eukprot:scaffold28653_cov42-Prasinocladus_malaysianus.AAC.1